MRDVYESDRYLDVLEALWARGAGTWYSYGDLAEVIQLHFAVQQDGVTISNVLKRVAQRHGTPNRARKVDGTAGHNFDPLLQRLWDERMQSEGLPPWDEQWPEWRRVRSHALIDMLSDILPTQIIYEPVTS
ncbi:MAG TPA: hypothetical protein VH419_00855 [Nocardioidaceae bacterium]|jgi:hypothetical protein